MNILDLKTPHGIIKVVNLSDSVNNNLQFPRLT